MIQKIIYILIVIAVAFGFYKLISQKPTSTNQNNSISQNSDFILYYGNTCPHCQKVEAWIKDNKADQKLKIIEKEVYTNTDNQKELATTVSQYCPDLGTQGGIGVPLGFDPINKKCIQGDQPIIDFLSGKIK